MYIRATYTQKKGSAGTSIQNLSKGVITKPNSTAVYNLSKTNSWVLFEMTMLTDSNLV
jgi:hypothetical protein